jgi:bisanhydrobacterioruberin hydratase
MEMGMEEVQNKTFLSFSGTSARLKYATVVALIVHLTGAVGILFFNTKFFISITPLVLLMNSILLFWTQTDKNHGFIIFFLLSFVIGIVAELIGVNTGWLFGNYRYSETWGIQVKGVPLLMGVNWFVLAYCSGVCIHLLFHSQSVGKRIRLRLRVSGIGTYSTVTNGALLATFFDWIMEPVALRLGYWTWADNGNIPGMNYISWFAVSVILLFIFQQLHFEKHNVFAVHLMLI